MEKPVTKRLLFDFFSEKSTAMQRKLIEEWLEDAANQELYYKYLDEWESENPQFFPDLDRAMRSYQVQLTGAAGGRASTGVTVKMQRIPLFRRKIWRQMLAAACVVIATCFLFRKELMYQSLNSASGHSASYQLSDGTTVLLNANSTLLVPRFGFGSGSREVELQGEADFNVTHTGSNNRFIVNMGDHYRIEVLGTQFVAYSRREEKRVFLSRGKVKLRLPQGKQVYMKPGNLFTSGSNGSFDMSVPAKPQKYTAWKEQLFYFDNSTLSEVARQMKERFDVDVRIPDTVLAERRIGGIYRAEHPDDLFSILSELLLIEVIQNQDHVELHIQKNQ
ncbi:FecR domain-containing protein [Dyadobacter sp. CY323]|nr:FecR domain-containing protein [Dyadobacter sp. CY323]